MGTYSHSMDDKGRLIIPARFREELGEGFVLTKNLDKCLALYPKQGWEGFTAALSALPKISSEAARRLRRFYFGNSGTCEVDRLGRILIPGVLRDYASLQRNVTLVGVDDHIEIWDEETWNHYNDALDPDEMVQDLKDLNL